MPTPMISAAWCREHGACYSDAKLAELLPQPITLVEALRREDVPAVDRCWVFFAAATTEQQKAVTDRIVTRAVETHALRCGIPAVEAWARKWLDGSDLSYQAAAAAAAAAAGWAAAVAWEEVRAEAAWASAARAAARAAAAAAWAEVRAEAERQRQVEDMIAVIEASGPDQMEDE